MRLIKKIGVVLSLAMVGVFAANAKISVSARPIAAMDPEKEQMMESCRLEEVNNPDYNDTLKGTANSYIASGYMAFDLNSLRENNITLKDFQNLDGDGVLLLNSYYPSTDVVVKKMSNAEFEKKYCGGKSSMKVNNRFYYDKFNRLETEVTYDSVGEVVIIIHHRFDVKALEFAE